MTCVHARSVSCGGSECTTTSNRTCCQAWSRGVGFEGSPTCPTQAACEMEHSPFEGDTNRTVLSECDEPADCRGGQVCCFLASCQLELGAPPKDADTNKVNLFIDGEQIPFDAQSAKQNGWGWANDTRQTMLMYGMPARASRRAAPPTSSWSSAACR